MFGLAVVLQHVGCHLIQHFVLTHVWYCCHSGSVVIDISC